MDQKTIELQARVSALEFLVDRLLGLVLYQLPQQQRQAVIAELYQKRKTTVHIDGPESAAAHAIGEQMAALTHHQIDDMLDKVVRALNGTPERPESDERPA